MALHTAARNCHNYSGPPPPPRTAKMGNGFLKWFLDLESTQQGHKVIMRVVFRESILRLLLHQFLLIGILGLFQMLWIWPTLRVLSN